MQEMIELITLKENKEDGYIILKPSIGTAKFEALLKKEKEVIVNAVKQGWDYNEEGLVQWMGETYYNETFNTEECYHKGKYTYNKETFECHKCGLIVPNEYRFNSKEK